MIGAKHSAQPGSARRALGHAGLVELVAEEVYPVRAGEIVEAVAVKVDEHHAIGSRGKGTDRQVPAHEGAVLERHAVGGSELQVGDARSCFLGELERARKAVTVQRREAREGGAAARLYLLGRTVAAEEAALVVGVPRYQRRHAPRQPGMAGEGRMLCA